MNTTRRNFLCAAGGIIAAGVVRSSFAADPEGAPPAKPPAMFSGPIESRKLEEGFNVLIGGGGNTTVLFDAGHLLVIDSGMPHRGEDLLKLAMQLSPQAVTKALFNTHWHFDHVGGNGAFVAAGFTAIGTTACRTRLGQRILLEDMGLTVEPTPEAARPTITFDKQMKLFSPLEVQITAMDPAHTDTDAIAWIEKYNTLITGDLHFSGIFPVIDRSTGGSLDGMIAGTQRLLTLGDDKTRVVPGHGPVGDKSALRAQLELLTLVHDRLAPMGAKKMTMDEVVAAAPLADLDDKWGRGFLRSPVFTKMAYGQWK